jgi:hypothetical protein
MRFHNLQICLAVALLCSLSSWADSVPDHQQAHCEKPQPWPGGIIPYDIFQLNPAQQTNALRAMQRWQDTGAKIEFVPRTTQAEYVYFTGKTNAGNNTSQVGFKPGKHSNINITAFWWRQGEWMPAHELGHVLGFFHEHQRWDRDQFITIHYKNVKAGRESDYDWIAQTNWLAATLPYDYQSLMHYRVCWASSIEDQCKDTVGSSPGAVISSLDSNYDRVIGQWGNNKISPMDAQRARLVYGTKDIPERKLTGSH